MGPSASDGQQSLDGVEAPSAMDISAAQSSQDASDALTSTQPGLSTDPQAASEANESPQVPTPARIAAIFSRISAATRASWRLHNIKELISNINSTDSSADDSSTSQCSTELNTSPSLQSSLEGGDAQQPQDEPDSSQSQAMDVSDAQQSQDELDSSSSQSMEGSDAQQSQDELDSSQSQAMDVSDAEQSQDELDSSSSQAMDAPDAQQSQDELVSSPSQAMDISVAQQSQNELESSRSQDMDDSDAQEFSSGSRDPFEYQQYLSGAAESTDELDSSLDGQLLGVAGAQQSQDEAGPSQSLAVDDSGPRQSSSSSRDPSQAVGASDSRDSQAEIETSGPANTPDAQQPSAQLNSADAPAATVGRYASDDQLSPDEAEASPATTSSNGHSGSSNEPGSSSGSTEVTDCQQSSYAEEAQPSQLGSVNQPQSHPPQTCDEGAIGRQGRRSRTDSSLASEFRSFLRSFEERCRDFRRISEQDPMQHAESQAFLEDLIEWYKGETKRITDRMMERIDKLHALASDTTQIVSPLEAFMGHCRLQARMLVMRDQMRGLDQCLGNLRAMCAAVVDAGL